jgi:hypothetical protein
VIGHLDVLVERGLVVETIDDHGNHLFRTGVRSAPAQPDLS